MRLWLLLTGAAALLLTGALVAGGAGWAGAQILPTVTPYGESPGCWAPPDDYRQTWVNGALLNARTIAMLDHAQALYSAQGGAVDLRLALVQGSYNPGGVAASFGTHDGGGALDLSVRSRVDWSVLNDEIEPMIRALRATGFAAWLRAEGELYPGSAIHIHAVAVGDAEASDEAQAQITGRFGYLRGYNGLPTISGAPIADRYGGPVICGWMAARGLGDMRGLPNPYPTPGGTTVPEWPIP